MKRQSRTSVRAFTLVELVAVAATIFLLASLLAPALAKNRAQSHSAIDLNNTRLILKAVQTYAVDNADYVPHPTWGSVPAGPTGWLYASGMPSGQFSPTASQAQIATVLSNQLRFFRRGQLAPYVNNDQTIFDCPTDVAMRRSGTYKTRYAERAVKLSSYGFTGAICGYGTAKTVPGADQGATYKLSDFRPTAFLMWEPDELVPFNFNDAGTNPVNAQEGVSARHTSAAGSGTTLSAPNGRALLGTFGGDASYIKIRTFTTLRQGFSENDLRCGPGFR